MARQNLDQVFEAPWSPIKVTKDDVNRSLAWFQEQTKRLGDRVSMNSLLQNNKRRTSNIMPGKMYLYMYDAKYADSLPYYDQFPLVIPFARDAETMTGLNFHYLNYKMRFILLKNLLDFSNDKKLNEKAKLIMSWDLIKGASRYTPAKAAVHKYRFDHIQSAFLEIPATQWFTALLMPVERFVSGKDGYKHSKEYVWQDSIRRL